MGLVAFSCSEGRAGIPRCIDEGEAETLPPWGKVAFSFGNNGVPSPAGPAWCRAGKPRRKDEEAKTDGRGPARD